MSSTPRTRAEARRTTKASSRQPRQPRPSGRRSWPRRILYTLLALFLLGVATVGVAYALIDTPKPNDLATAQTSIVYFADGKTEMGRISDSEGNRESVELSQVPLHVQRAFVAAEDRDFYQNNGISPTGIARAVWVAIKGGEATQGGSTITQQYVKNYFLTQDRTLTRKGKEILISLKIDGQQSKDEILANYLNTIYYGRGAYGIQTASKAYFGKDVSKLTPAEGAFLASVIRGPSLYDPRLGESQVERAKSRSAYILDAMVTEGWLSPEDRAKATFPESFVKYSPPKVSGPNGYAVQLVKDELSQKVKLSDSDISRGGLRIVTTIDVKKQKAAQEAIADRLEGTKNLNVGLASVKPGDGAVEALYGGADFAKRERNTATQDTMQAGSTFKVFALIAALQSGEINLRNTFPGQSPQFFEEFENPAGKTEFSRRGGVNNYNDEDFGRINLIRATANSVNTVYARLNIEAGPKKTSAAAAAAGVTTKLSPNYANVLGTDSVKVIDMANAYATLAAKGVRATPYYVKSVTSVDESFDYTAKPVTKRVFEEDIVADVVYAMQAVVDEGSGEYAGRRLDRPAAGKTGTSSDQYSAWFDGFVPQLATAVGMFEGDGSQKEANQMKDVPGWGNITGGTIPVRIWTDYMRVATEGMEVVKFPEPAYVNRDAAPKQTQRPENNNDDSDSNEETSRPETSRPEPEPSTSTPEPTTPSPTPTPEPTTPKPTPTPEPSQPEPTITIPVPPGNGGGGGGGGGGNNDATPGSG